MTLFLLLDYIILLLLTASSLCFILITWSRYSTVRPLTPATKRSKFIRPVTKQQNHHSNNLTTYWIWNCNFSVSIVILIFTKKYEWLVSNSYFNLTETYWLYLLSWWVILSFVWQVLITRAELERLIHEHFITILIIFLSIQLYYLVTNIWALTLVLEIQGAALLLLIDIDHVFYKKEITSTTTATTNYQNAPVATALLIQFWVSFLGAILFLLTGGFLIQTTGTAHWQDCIIFIYFKIQQTGGITPALSILSLILISLLLKTGSAPLHFWKPELYNALRISNVFVYAVPYASAVAFIIIFINHILITTSPSLTKSILWIITLLTTYVAAPLLAAVTEIKLFIAYTSGLHAIYIYTAPTTDRLNVANALLYNLNYTFAALLFFIILLAYRINSLKYLTDLQIYAHLPQKIFLISIALATMAGVPPLLGFWAKFNVLYNLWVQGGWLIVLHLLSISMIYLYFYIALYRFAGAINFKVNNIRLQLVKRSNILTGGVILSLLHLLGTAYIADFSNWTALFAQQFYAYY